MDKISDRTIDYIKIFCPYSIKDFQNIIWGSDEEKINFMELSTKLNKKFEENLVTAKIAEEYFTPENLEKYIQTKLII